MIQTTILALEDAKRIAAAARAEADRNGWPMVIAILDDGGHLMYLERIDGKRVLVSKRSGDHRHRQLRRVFRCDGQSDVGHSPR